MVATHIFRALHEDAQAPLVWCLQGSKAGDNAQIHAVAEALSHLRECRVHTIELEFRPIELAVNLLLGVSLHGLRDHVRGRIAPPWPHLILTAGRRNEPVARWIQRASGMRTRLVHLGRPWADPRRFDLVVTTPQYRLDPHRHPNVRVLPMPPVTQRRAEPPAADAPLLLLLGGDSGSKLMDADMAEAWFDRARVLAQTRSSGLRVSTSPRTPSSVSARLHECVQQHADDQDIEFYDWRAHGGRDNPYAGWLSETWGCIVTEDSMSMVADVAALQRPLWIARLRRDPRPWWTTARGWRWRSATHELAQRFAPLRFRRDTHRLLEGLVLDGRAQWLDDERAMAFEPQDARRSSTDAERAATAVATLL